jgi:hypothetical protein
MRQALMCIAGEQPASLAESGAAVDPAALARYSVLDLLVDVALGTGFVLPVLELATQGVAGGGLPDKVVLAVQVR